MEPLEGKNAGGGQDVDAALKGLKEKGVAAREKEFKENIWQGLKLGLGAFGVFLAWIALLFALAVLIWAFGIF